jgi:hypothetical protein
MDERQGIECDFHDLLDEANVMLLMHQRMDGKLEDLIKRLTDCAQKATSAGRDDVCQRLERAIEALVNQARRDARG